MSEVNVKSGIRGFVKVPADVRFFSKINKTESGATGTMKQNRQMSH